MPQTHPAAATDQTAQTTRAPAPPAELTLEDRLTFITAAMTMRLDEAAVAYEVNIAHIATEPVDLADAITGPLTPAAQPRPDLYPTPVAALLQRAHHRLTIDGWCTGALTDDDGALCLMGAIRAESDSSPSREAQAMDVLTETIHRKAGPVESVPAFNDAFRNARTPLRMLEQAAALASDRGL
ncbi:DUF6197 family protein [Streptomyces scopuliridis]|uniref:DUF6197 family protein n=1 Tax=Streptomyces scopuliridis TaxID=452529 RepID=UPI00342C44D0